ncbi:MAG: phage portal protein [Actinomycetes bacterium]
MSFLFGGRQKRSEAFAGLGPPIPRNSEQGTWGGSFDRVDLRRAEASLQKVAVWACVDLITTTTSELPLDLFRNAEDRKPLGLPGWLDDLDRTGQGLADWTAQALLCWLLRGNLVGTVPEWGPDGPRAILLYHPDQVSGWYDPVDGLPRWRGPRGPLNPVDVFHRRTHPVPTQLLGLSPISHCAATIGLGIQAERYGSQWFTDGAHPSGLLVNSEVDLKARDPESGKSAAEVAKERFMAALRGSREPLVLGKGWSFQAIQVNPNESQFLETQKFTGAQCCRIFGPGLAELLGYETGGSLTYANVEQRGIDLLKFVMNPWLRRMERLLSSLLPDPQYVRFNRDALLSTSALERWRKHEIALRNRATTVNEVRDIEDMPPVEWGEEPNAQGAAPQTVTVEE